MTKKEKLIFGENGVEYRGGLKKGKPHGKGTIYFFEGKKSNEPTATTFDLAFFKVAITGALESNKTSKSKSSKKNNVLTTKYEGQFNNGNWHGEFTCTNYLPRNKERHFIIKINNNKILSDMEKVKHPNGDVYIGEFKGEEFHGKGTLTSKDGSKYEGTWKKGVPHGKGKRKYLGGDLYVGHWKNKKIHGKGTYTFSNGDKYIGDWKNNKMHGKGTYTFPDGEKYIGDWKNGKKHGKGTETFPNGAKYIGDWKNEKKHGKGLIEDSTGFKIKGSFINGDIDIKKKCRIKTPYVNSNEGVYYDGYVNSNLDPHGRGTKVDENFDLGMFGEEYIKEIDVIYRGPKGLLREHWTIGLWKNGKLIKEDKETSKLTKKLKEYLKKKKYKF